MPWVCVSVENGVPLSYGGLFSGQSGFVIRVFVFCDAKIVLNICVYMEYITNVF